MTRFHRLLFGVALAGCAVSEAAPMPQLVDPGGPHPLAEMTSIVSGLVPKRAAPAAALDHAIATYYAGVRTERIYIQTDKPLYQPGETVWLRADLRATKTLLGGPPGGATLQLLSPRGAIVATKYVLVQNGVARNDFALGPDVEGGEYTIQVTSPQGAVDTKKFVVNTYEAPRLMKTLELLRKAYGAGDAVTAAVEIKKPTGEPLADHAITAVVTLDDAELSRTTLKTDHDGKTLAKFSLPATIARGDGLLTILVEDGGVTESIQKRIPIVMTTLQLGVFPEGGDLVAGVPSRVYFMAKTTVGKPADVEGNVVDDRGAVVTAFSSLHDGMGRFELRPDAARHYHLEITKPANIVTRVDVPAPRPDGCVLRSVDQRTGAQLRVLAICKTAQRVSLEATLREQQLAGGAFDVEAGKAALLELPIAASAQGAVRVTLFSKAQEPLAERLVYHGANAGLRVTLTPDRATYSPRAPVKLHVHTTDAHGTPVKANLGVAVVDDTVLSFADDKSARILAHTYLEPELGATAADPIEDPNYYFSDKPDAAAAMDALLATRGYRRFEWRQVLPALGSKP